jgi:peptidyl-prolyl cis-trans isomerase SurA
MSIDLSSWTYTVSFRRTAIVTLATISMMLSGCSKKHSANVVALVNGHPILRSELDKNYQAQERQRESHGAETQEEADNSRVSILLGMINAEIVWQRAAQMKLTATDDEVDAKLAEMKAGSTKEQFDQWLQQTNQTTDDLRNNLRRSITIDRLLNKEINSKIEVTDAEVSHYYYAHKENFNLTEDRYHVAQIVVTSQPMQGPANSPNSKAISDADAKKKIQMIANRLDSGEDFGLVAMNLSEDPQTAPNGGDLGFLTESQLRSDPQVFAAISKLKAGETTNILPIYSRSDSKQIIGYSIFKLISRETSGQKDLTSPLVQQSIRDQLRNSRSQLAKSTYLEMLNNQARVENYFAQEVYKRATK